MKHNISAMTRRILRWHDAATPAEIEGGSTWYLVARALVSDLAATYGYTVEQVSATIAALSPQTSWPQNVKGSRQACERHASGEWDDTLPGYPGYGANVVKAGRILAGDVGALKGPKVEAFHRAIMGDLSQTVIDAWAARAARSQQDNVARLFRSDEMPGATERRAMQEAYRRAAAARGIEPAVMQARVWLSVKASGRYVAPAGKASTANRWYARQHRARVALGLSNIVGDYAWKGAPRGQAHALSRA